MRKKYDQMSLLDTYKSIEERLGNNKPELFLLSDEHLNWEEIIPVRFYCILYRPLMWTLTEMALRFALPMARLSRSAAMQMNLAVLHVSNLSV